MKKIKRRELMKYTRMLQRAILSVLMIKNGFTVQPGPSSTFEKAYKSVKFRLVVRKVPFNGTRWHLGTAWSVDQKDPNNPNEHREDPKPTFLSIFSNNVYGVKLGTSWMLLERGESSKQSNSKGLPLYPLFESLSSEITAYQMEGGGDILTLAFKNGTVLGIDVQQTVFGEDPSIHISFKRDLRQNYRFHLSLKPVDFEEVEKGEGIVHSIGRIPHTDLLILVPNFGPLIKFSTSNSAAPEHARSPLDKVRNVVPPSQTTHPSREPYSPHFVFPRRFANNRGIEQQQYFKVITMPKIVALTSANTEFTALVDYTTMKNMNYFTVRKGFEIYSNPSKYVITSICFYGAVPEAYTYAVMTKNTRKQIVLFDGIFRMYKGEIDLKTAYQNTELTWLNGTSYILACQYNNEDTRCHPTLVDFSPIRAKDYTVSFRDEAFTLPVSSGFQMVAYEMKSEFGAIKSLNYHTNLHYLFLTLYQEGDDLHVRPPFFGWNLCRDKNLDDSFKDPKFRMLVGTSVICPSPPKKFSKSKGKKNIFCGPSARCISESSNVTEIAESIGFRANIYMRPCLNPKQNIVLAAEFDTVSGEFICSSKPYRTSYTVKEIISKMSNYHRLADLLPCPQNKVINIFGEVLKVFDPSTFGLCLLHDHTYKIDDMLLNNPKCYITYANDNFLGCDLYSMSYLFKGVGGINRHSFIDHNNTYYLIRGSNSRDLNKQCSFISPGSRVEPGHFTSPKHPYILKPVPPSLVGKYLFSVSNRHKREFYCAKTCKSDYYYDYDSIDCRKCAPGCFECTSWTQCTKHCPDGKMRIIEPKFDSHLSAFHQSERKGKFCLKRGECQKGFFFQWITNKCVECEENCLSCKFDENLNRARCLEPATSKLSKSTLGNSDPKIGEKKKVRMKRMETRK